MIDPAAIPTAPSEAPAATDAPAPTDPALPPDLLRRYLDLDHLASHTALPLDTLLAWAETPAVAAAAAAWVRHRQLALEASLAEARLLILPALTRLATSAESPLERRRAATLIFRGERARHHPPPPGEVPASSPAEGATSSTTPTHPPRPQASVHAGGAAQPRSPRARAVPNGKPDPAPVPTVTKTLYDPIAGIYYQDDGRYFPACDPGPTAEGVLNRIRRAEPRTPAAALTAVYPALAHYLKMRSTRDPDQLREIEQSRILDAIDYPYTLDDPAHTPATEDCPPRATIRASFATPGNETRDFTLHLLHDDYYRKGKPVWRFERLTPGDLPAPPPGRTPTARHGDHERLAAARAAPPTADTS